MDKHGRVEFRMYFNRRKTRFARESGAGEQLNRRAGVATHGFPRLKPRVIRGLRVETHHNSHRSPPITPATRPGKRWGGQVDPTSHRLAE